MHTVQNKLWAWMAAHRVVSGLSMPVVVMVCYFGLGLVGIALVSDEYVATVLVDVVAAVLMLWLLSASGLHMPAFTWKKSRTDKKWGMSIACVCAVILVWIVGQSATTAVYNAVPDTAYQSYQQASESTSIYVIVLVSVCLAPIVEELLFRGVAFASLSRAVGAPVAALLSSAGFAVMHGTLVHLPFTFLLGMVGCCIYSLTGKLWCSMAAHIGCNAVSMLPVSFYVPGFLSSLPVLIVAYVAILAALTVFCGVSGRGMLDWSKRGLRQDELSSRRRFDMS